MSPDKVQATEGERVERLWPAPRACGWRRRLRVRDGLGHGCSDDDR